MVGPPSPDPRIDPSIVSAFISWLPVATLVGVTLVVVIGMLVALAITLRGTAPADRPEIVRALAELFRRNGGPPTGTDSSTRL